MTESTQAIIESETDSFEAIENSVNYELGQLSIIVFCLQSSLLDAHWGQLCLTKQERDEPEPRLRLKKSKAEGTFFKELSQCLNLSKGALRVQ